MPSTTSVKLCCHSRKGGELIGDTDSERKRECKRKMLREREREQTAIETGRER